MHPTFTARYIRYGAVDTREWDSLDDAVAYLARGQDECEFSPLGVVCPDGATLEGDELRDRLEQWMDRQIQQWMD